MNIIVLIQYQDCMYMLIFCKYLPVDIHFMLILLVKHSSDTYIRNYICKVIDDLIIKINY